MDKLYRNIDGLQILLPIMNYLAYVYIAIVINGTCSSNF